MKARSLLLVAAPLALLSTLNPQFSTAFAQGTAFTYQGRLARGGGPANGLYEVSFTLFDAVTSGNVVGTPQTIAPLPVSNGLFTATLDFGANAFTGAARWLEISVTVFDSDQPVVTLTPRQPLAPAPYALHADNAAGLMSFADAPLDIKVNGQRLLRLELNSASANIIAGFGGNVVSNGVTGGTISGGGKEVDINAVGGDFATVAGGFGNVASEFAATVSGGFLNLAIGGSGTVAGGSFNSAAGLESTVSGGSANFAFGEHATVAGGWSNIARGSSTAVSGGDANQARDFASTVGGGFANRAEGDNATVSGGQRNVASGPGVTVSGGSYNSGEGSGVTIGGGMQNYATGFAATVGGGDNNMAVDGGTVAGGAGNRASGDSSSVSGGQVNSAAGFGAVVGGGYENNSSGSFAAIGGGERNAAGGESTTISGGSNNSIETDADHSSISGGQGNKIVGATGCVIGGGIRNTISSNAFESFIGGGGAHCIDDGAYGSTVSGGSENEIRAHAYASTIAGGAENQVYTRSPFASISGGNQNSVRSNAWYATIAGGCNNNAGPNTYFASIPGGRENWAWASYSLAAGRQAKALHEGAFVWADAGRGLSADSADFASSATNEFAVRATGGVRFVTAIDAGGTNIAGVTLAPGSGSWSSLSDRDAKQNFATADAREILEKVAVLPLASWNYKAQSPGVRHLGPTAQDFHAAFGLGESDRTITTVDADGVALAAIQGLNEKVEVRNEKVEGRIEKLETELEQKETEITKLKQRLQRLEQLFDSTNGGSK